MKVFFTCSTSQIDAYFDLYKYICDSILALGHQLTKDWLDEAVEIKRNGRKVNFEEMYDEVVEGILASDVCVVEGTVKGLSTGHLMTLALERKKPVLFLHQGAESDGLPFIVGDDLSSLLTDCIYKDRSEISELLNDFFKFNERGQKVRFNLVLSRAEENYLKWVAYRKKTSVTEILRNYIQEKISTDKDYHS